VYAFPTVAEVSFGADMGQIAGDRSDMRVKLNTVTQFAGSQFGPGSQLGQVPIEIAASASAAINCSIAKIGGTAGTTTDIALDATLNWVKIIHRAR
jgi:hypothetical protein